MTVKPAQAPAGSYFSSSWISQIQSPRLHILTAKPRDEADAVALETAVAIAAAQLTAVFMTNTMDSTAGYFNFQPFLFSYYFAL